MTIDTKMQTILNYTLRKYLVGGSFLGRFDFSIMWTKIHRLGWVAQNEEWCLNAKGY